MPVENSSKKRSWLKKVLLVLSGLLGLILVLIMVGVALAPDYAKKKTAAGFPINSTLYLAMDETTYVWISVWLPPGLGEGERIPALMRTSRYAEQFEDGWLSKVQQTYMGKPSINYDAAKAHLDKGYAYVWVQSPGSCQSSGPRPTEYPPSEIDAMGLAIDWIADQPWSNGRVGAFGGSYSGTTADMACATLRPQLKAVFPSAPDFDVYCQTIKPGGLGSREFFRTWAGMIRAMDSDDFIQALSIVQHKELSFLEKIFFRSAIRGLQRPRGKDRAIFDQALKDHAKDQALNPDIDILVAAMDFKDSPSPTLPPFSMEDVAVYRYKEKIEKAQVNTNTRVGWMDAGIVEGALQKYLTFTTPQKLVILPTGHPQNEFVNPFGENEAQIPGLGETNKRDFYEFFDRHLKGEGEEKERRRIIYFTYGINEWRETEVWPPEGIAKERWYLSSKEALAKEPPGAEEGSDLYTVDFMATTGFYNRWMSQIGQPVRYTDRREEDGKLLTYTSPPLTSDLEVTGSPTVTLYLASTHQDGAVHIYLEDVGPEGRVSYLTEGLLRVIHRKASDPASAPFVPLGVYHTFRKADAQPLVPGETAEIAVTLFPVSTVFRKGHAIRIAIAGHDRALQDKYPAEGIPVLTIQRNSVYPSHVELPVKAYQKTG